MSGFENYEEQRPAHRVHNPNSTVRPVADYSADAFERQPTPAGGWDRTHVDEHPTSGHAGMTTTGTTGLSGTGPTTESAPKRAVHSAEATVERGEAKMAGAAARRRSASSSSSSSDEGARLRPAGRDAAVGEATGAERKPTMGDKVLGKTEKLVGKMTRNPAKVEEGQIRATEGKAAAQEHVVASGI